MIRREVFRRLQHCIDANSGRGIAIRAENVEVQVRVRAEVAEVVFAGSNQVKDWLRNVQIAREHIPGVGGIHMGRMKDWRAIQTPLMRHLDQYAPGLPVDLSGHSQGAALAQVAAIFIDRPVDSVVTFAGHRVFDLEAEATYYSHVLYTRRVVVDWDCVPRWPKNSMGYVHAGPMLCLAKGGKQVREQARPRWYLPWEYLTKAGGDHISDDEYYRAVRDWAAMDPEAEA